VRVFDADASGPANPVLYVGGNLESNVMLKTWDGTSWGVIPMPAGNEAEFFTVEDLEVGRIGTRRVLFDAGWSAATDSSDFFRSAIAWNGTTFESYGDELSPVYGALYPEANTVCPTTLDGQPAIFVGGHFDAAGDLYSPNGAFLNLASGQWTPHIDGSANGLGITGFGRRSVSALVDVDGAGPTPPRIVGAEVPGQTPRQFDGVGWSDTSLPPLPDGSPVFVRYDRGDGDALYCATNIDANGARLLRLNAGSWQNVATFVSGTFSGVGTSAIFDVDGPGPERPWMFFGGIASSEPLIDPYPGIVAHDGFSERTFPLFGGDGSTNVRSMAVFNDGSGAKLYLAGHLRPNPGNPALRGVVARFDGTTWQTLATGDAFGVQALRIVDLGAGPRLLACGNFSSLNGNSGLLTLAEWTASGWTNPTNPTTTVEPGVGVSVGTIDEVAAFDDGSGPALYAAGQFATIGGVPSSRLVAKWSGSAWAALGSGPNNFADNPRAAATRLLVMDDDVDGPAPAALYVTGSFDSAGGVYSANLARWGVPLPVCDSIDFSRDGIFPDNADLIEYIEVLGGGACG
jgi:hypothetical protein